MAGSKPSILNSGDVATTIGTLSKNTLIDVLADRARAELGEHACDETVVALIQKWVEPVQVARNDKPARLREIFAYLKECESLARGRKAGEDGG